MSSEEALKAKYDVKEELGRGAFSTVHKCVDKKTGGQYAVKVIDKHKATGGEAEEKRLRTEIAILQTVKHPNIVGLVELFDTNEHLYLVMDLVTGGELFDKIVEKGQYTEREASQTMKSLLNAIEYLHSKGIAHRDLKPENLLLKSANNITDVLLSDFGLSKIVSQESMMATACGTPYYVAPEVLSATGYDVEVDLWSCGVIAYLLLCGFPPFYGDSLPEVFELIMKADYDFPSPYWDAISPEAKDFIKKLLVVDAGSRLSATEALKHPWITQGGHDKKIDLKGEKITQYQSQRKLQKSSQNVKK